MKLFCFPYAGASAMIYSKWNRYLDSSIEFHPVEIPGRGKRINENLLDRLDLLVEDVFNNIEGIIKDGQNYMMFGHSMGSLIAYELYYKICDKGYKLPSHIFFSGRRPPQLHNREEITYNLPDNRFIERVYRLGGTPKEIIEDDDLMRIFMPILRADHKAVETYIYKERREEKLSTDITVLYGNDDECTPLEDVVRWKECAGGGYEICEFKGDHFFINKYFKEIVRKINITKKKV